MYVGACVCVCVNVRTKVNKINTCRFYKYYLDGYTYKNKIITTSSEE